MDAASKTLAPVQRDALAKIRNRDRRNLAMTYYLRAGASLAARWSWTEDQIKAYEGSSEYRDVIAEIEMVAARFAAQNPGYVLYTNTQIRSLEEQLQRWQKVSSIGVAATELRKNALTFLTQDIAVGTPDDVAAKQFQAFLIAWRASKPPTLAAPGLSLHGQGRAYDFQIGDAKGRIVAGTAASTVQSVWDRKGWTEKLSRAVHAASDKFVGPLTAPREPWHYEYRNAADASK